MTTTTTRKVLMGLCTVLTLSAFLAVNAAAQTSSTQRVKGAATSTTKLEHGTVTYVEGNTVVIKMSTGEMRTVNVPDSRTAIVDGREITVHDLKPGTTLTATLVTTTTPVTERTTTNLTGKVWYVSGNTVILTLPDGNNKMYTPKADVKFTVDGRRASVHDLRKGMTIFAEKIVEAPSTEIANNTTVTGQAPKPKPVVAEVQHPAPAPAREAVATHTPAPAPAAAPAPTPEQSALPATLPTTGSPLPLLGVLGLLLMSAGFGLRSLRRN